MKSKILILALLAVAFVTTKEANAGILGRIFCNRTCTSATCNYQVATAPCEAVQTVEEPAPCESVQTAEEKVAVPECVNGACKVRTKQVTRTYQRRTYCPTCRGNSCIF